MAHSSIFIVRLLLGFALAAVMAAASTIAGMPDPVLWPQPQRLQSGSNVLAVSSKFSVQCKSSSPIVQNAVQRYTAIIANTKYVHLEIQYPYPKIAPTASAVLSSLVIEVADDRDTSLQLGFDESYSLDINAPAATLRSNKVWGVIRGLETFSQTIQFNGTQRIIQNAPLIITDAPRYPWRGYLLDTARHYLKPTTIKKVIEMMAQVKFNVFHWHLTDAELISRPELSEKGSWTPSAVYTAADVADIIEHAKSWGVRVVPEFDTPGHTFSWAASHPEVVLNCSKRIELMGNNVNIAALDMTNPATYNVVSDVFKDAANAFSDSYVHLGGDEVIFDCLNEFPRIKEWMKNAGMNSSNYADLIQFYSQKLAAIVNRDNRKNMVFWQEAFYNAYKNPSKPKPLPPNTIFQVWINPQRNAVITDMLTANMPVLVSSGWYLDQQVPSLNGTTHYLWEDTFMDFYANELESGLSVSPDQLKLILGGEVCQWGEQINDEVLWERMMPKAAGAAERLWSPKAVNNLAAALQRVLSVRCRLAQRGYPQSGMRPDYCEMPDA